MYQGSGISNMHSIEKGKYIASLTKAWHSIKKAVYF